MTENEQLLFDFAKVSMQLQEVYAENERITEKEKVLNQRFYELKTEILSRMRGE